MDKRPTINRMVNILENNGTIILSTSDSYISIESVDSKEGYSYVSNTHEEFDSSSEAIKWAIEQIDGIHNITEWK